MDLLNIKLSFFFFYMNINLFFIFFTAWRRPWRSSFRVMWSTWQESRCLDATSTVWPSTFRTAWTPSRRWTWASPSCRTRAYACCCPAWAACQNSPRWPSTAIAWQPPSWKTWWRRWRTHRGSPAWPGSTWATTLTSSPSRSRSSWPCGDASVCAAASPPFMSTARRSGATTQTWRLLWRSPVCTRRGMRRKTQGRRKRRRIDWNFKPGVFEKETCPKM